MYFCSNYILLCDVFCISTDATLTPVLNMRIAVEGCTHGELDKIYSTLQELETKQGYKVKIQGVRHCG